MCVCVREPFVCVLCLVLCGGGSRIVMWCACVGKRSVGRGSEQGERRRARAKSGTASCVCSMCVCEKKRRARAVGGGDEGMAVEACVLGSVERSAQESAVERRERSGGGAREKGELSGFAQSRMSIK